MTGLAVWQDWMPGDGYAWAIAFDSLSDRDQDAIFFGRRLSEPLPSPTVSELTEGELGDLVGSGASLLIVSPSLRRVLDREAGSATQLIPVEIDGHPDAGYAIVNVLTELDLLDRDRSSCSRDEDGLLMGVRSLALRPVPADAPPIFRLVEPAGVVVVERELREALEAAATSPGRFVPVEDFRWGDDS